MDRIEYFKGKDGKWYFSFIAANNECVARCSQGYDNKADMRTGLLAAARVAEFGKIVKR